MYPRESVDVVYDVGWQIGKFLVIDNLHAGPTREANLAITSKYPLARL
jgi:hypothetical protein